MEIKLCHDQLKKRGAHTVFFINSRKHMSNNCACRFNRINFLVIPSHIQLP